MGSKSSRAATHPHSAPLPTGAPKVGYVLEPSKRAPVRVLTDEYVLPEKESGRGHYGVVKFATHKRTKKLYAVKSVPKRRAVYVEMLKREVEILRNLDHVNVIKLHDAFEDEKEVHLLFDVCKGGELFESIANRQFRFSEFQAARLVRKLLQGVKHCHDNGIVHRDLKPENLLLDALGVESELKVIDFGLATYVEAGKRLTKHVGTPYYIAPEVLRKEYDEKCDLWSVGVILFTIMCGFPPFWGDTEREIYSRIRRGFYAFEGPDWAVRSLACKDLVNQLLTPEPVERLDVNQALQHPWIVHEGMPHMHPYSKKLFSRLRRFAGFPLLKRLALVMLARSLTVSESSRQLEWYRSFDRTEEGYLSFHAIHQAAESREVRMTDSEVADLINGVGVLRAGVITYYEFVAATTPRTIYLDDKRMLELFEVMDCNQDGFVCAKDVQATVGGLGEDDASYAESIVAEADLDAEGNISFHTFLRVVCGFESRVF